MTRHFQIHLIYIFYNALLICGEIMQAVQKIYWLCLRVGVLCVSVVRSDLPSVPLHCNYSQLFYNVVAEIHC